MEIIHSSYITKVLKFNLNKERRYSIIFINNLSDKEYKLLDSKGINEIKLDELDDDERIRCEKEYISNVSNLSSKLHSVDWWANPVSEKNEHKFHLYNTLCSFYSIIKTLKTFSNTDESIFIICNEEIFEQLKYYCNENSIRLKSLDNHLSSLRSITQIVLFLINTIFFILKTLVRKIYISYCFGSIIRKELDRKKKYYVIRTWIHSGFLKERWPYKDSYFGRLPEYINKQKYNLLILAGILNNYFTTVRAIKSNPRTLIIPELFFLKISDLFKLFFFFRWRKIKLNSRIFFNGVDVTVIYSMEINKGNFNNEYISNISKYYVAKRFSETVDFNNYIQAFENYAWEKMMILGLRKGTSNAKLLGFQHAFVSRNSFKYFPGKMEKDIIPLPDRIITMGKVTKEIMEKYGSYDPDNISIGCALRQEYLSNLKPLKRRNFNKVVVPLTMVKNESLSVMNFLYDSGLAHSGIKVVVRCHPSTPFESFSKELDFIMPDNFLVSNEKTVRDELSDTDMVLYTWTTVAVEALKMGLPIIYIDVLKPMFVDPLFECYSLKRSVSKPDKLLPTIESIYKMDDEAFYSEHKIAQEYLKEYFKPVTDDILESAFVKV